MLTNEKLPLCPGCDRRLPRHDQSYRGLLFHDLSRTAARNLRSSGMADPLIMDIGGWKTPAVFKRYAISDRRSKAAAMRQYERYQQELAQDRAESGHSLGILGDSKAENTPDRKLQ